MKRERGRERGRVSDRQGQRERERWREKPHPLTPDRHHFLPVRALLSYSAPDERTKDGESVAGVAYIVIRLIAVGLLVVISWSHVGGDAIQVYVSQSVSHEQRTGIEAGRTGRGAVSEHLMVHERLHLSLGEIYDRDREESG
jgi:hypothetical protein